MCVFNSMNWLVLSTLPHFYCIRPLLHNYERFAGYIHVVMLSTTLSVLYHTDESNRLIAGLDHVVALIWFVCDVGFGWSRRYALNKIIHANLISFIAHFSVPHDDRYILYHSVWHLLNAAKCYYVCTLLARRDSVSGAPIFPSKLYYTVRAPATQPHNYRYIQTDSSMHEKI